MTWHIIKFHTKAWWPNAFKFTHVKHRGKTSTGSSSSRT